MRKEDFAWLACAIDGEGSIIYHGTCWSIQIYNTNRAFVEKAAKLLGSKVKVRKHKNPKYSPCYITMVASRKKLKELLPKLLPFLIIKNDLAQKALKWANQNPEEVEKQRRKKVSQAMKKHWKDPEYRRKISEAVKRQWQNPEIRRKMIEGSDGKSRERKRETMKKLWQTKEYRQRVLPKIIAANKSEERRRKISRISKEKWKDPEYRRKVIEGLRKSRSQPNLAQQDDEYVHQEKLKQRIT